MVDYSKLPKTAMWDYLNETHSVLQDLLDHRTEYFKPFSDLFQKEEIQEIICTGSGTSYHCAESVRGFMSEVLRIPVLADYPRLIENYVKVIDRKVLTIGVSQSGESKSTVSALLFMKRHGSINVGFSEQDHCTSMNDCCDLVLPLHCGEELAGPKTKGYEASMMCLILCALETAHDTNRIDDVKYFEYVQRLQNTINNVDPIISESVKWYERNEAELVEAKRFIVVGSENNYGDVLEGRLKLEESIRFGVEGYELEEFMHGIYHSIDENVQLFYLAQEGKYKDRTFRLKNFLTDYSHHEYAIGNFAGMVDADDPKDLSYSFVDDPYFCPLEYILPLQILAYRLSTKKGINANIPKIPNFHHLMGSK